MVSKHALDRAASSGRYATRPGQIPRPGWIKILKRTLATMSATDLSLRCAGVAFFTFLSIFPVLACFVLIYGLVATPDSLRAQLEALRAFAPASVFNIVQERLEALLSQPEVGLGIGLAISFTLALWSGSRGVNALIGTISFAYRETDERSFISAALTSVGLTLGALVFLVIALFTIAGLPVILAATPFVSNMAETVALWARWPVLALFVCLSMAVLFRIAPHRESAQWKWITPGALVATVLWVMLSVLFSIYVEQFGNYSATFGSLSVAVVMMLWTYYSTMIVTLGASLNAEIEHQTKVDTTTGPSAPMGDRGAFVADHLADDNSSLNSDR